MVKGIYFYFVGVAGLNNSAIALEDFNYDGIIDLVTSQSGNSQLFKSTPGEPGVFTNPSSYPVGESLTSINAADLNGDGFLDVVGTGIGVSGAIVLTNQITQAATAQLNIVLPPNRSQIIANYSGDASHLPSSSRPIILP